MRGLLAPDASAHHLQYGQAGKETPGGSSLLWRRAVVGGPI